MDFPGLSEVEATIYRAVATRTTTHEDDLARDLGMATDVVGPILADLTHRGLLVRRQGRLLAVRPAVALGALLADRHGELRRAESTLAELDELFIDVRKGAMPDAVVDVVHGREEVASRLGQIQQQARREVLSLVKAPVAVVGSSVNGVAEDEAVRRGVRYRVVLERAMLEAEPRLVDELQVVRARGEEVRVAATVPIKMFVVDRELALVPLGIGRAPVESAFLISASGLLHALVALFESVWDSAREVGVGSTTPNVEDERLLTMLLAGLTDEAIARDMEISVRTVQRRVRGLLDLAGVDTRLQLGYAIARRGWAERDDTRPEA